MLSVIQCVPLIVKTLRSQKNIPKLRFKGLEIWMI